MNCARGIRLLKMAVAVVSLAWCGSAFAQEKKEHGAEAQSFVHGAPGDPSEAWTLAAGGRIYDNWWEALDRKKPQSGHPSYPAEGKAEGPGTWRCKECHGWDYKGRDGEYSTGSHYSGIKGIRAARGRSPDAIMKMLRAPLHGYTPEMITDVELRRLALFVSKGQHDVDRLKNAKSGQPVGNLARGRELFQTTCAACHGYDGRMLNWGSKEEPAYIGTDSNKFPWEFLHKVRNSHPGAAMINLRALSIEDAASVLAYSRTLPKQ
jgi:thiosulfate dehydrogenase